MRQAAAFMVGAGSVAVIAVGLQVGLGGLTHQASAATTSPTTSNTAAATPAATSATSATASPASPSASGSTSPAAPSSPSSGITGTFHGVDVPDDAGYGDVQVDVVFKNGTITDVVFVSANATKGRDQAFPMLRSATLSAQSASISNIGGATYTTGAYMRSVQSALDAAGFKG